MDDLTGTKIKLKKGQRSYVKVTWCVQYILLLTVMTLFNTYLNIEKLKKLCYRKKRVTFARYFHLLFSFLKGGGKTNAIWKVDLEKEKKGNFIVRPSCPVLTSSVRSKNHTNTNLWKPFPTLWPITCKTEWKKHIFIEGNKKNNQVNVVAKVNTLSHRSESTSHIQTQIKWESAHMLSFKMPLMKPKYIFWVFFLTSFVLT